MVCLLARDFCRGPVRDSRTCNATANDSQTRILEKRKGELRRKKKGSRKEKKKESRKERKKRVEKETDMFIFGTLFYRMKIRCLVLK